MMLAIVPGVTCEISSDSSDSTDSSEEKSDKLTNVIKRKTGNSNTGARWTSLNRFQPADAGNEPTRSAVDPHSPRTVSSTSSSSDIHATTHATPLALPELTDEKQKALSVEHLRKFAELKEKRLQSCEKISEGYRRPRRKRKRKNADTGPEERESDGERPRKTSSLHDSLHGRPYSDGQPGSDSKLTEAGPSASGQDEQWNTLKGYLDVNSHISQGVHQGQYAPKSGLEKKLDEAVAEGDFERAEELSEELSVRDFACRVAKAADARDYMKWKNDKDEEKAAKKRKKKKKLQWGFEVKNRWEMKANM